MRLVSFFFFLVLRSLQHSDGRVVSVPLRDQRVPAALISRKFPCSGFMSASWVLSGPQSFDGLTSWSCGRPVFTLAGFWLTSRGLLFLGLFVPSASFWTRTGSGPGPPAGATPASPQSDVATVTSLPPAYQRGASDVQTVIYDAIWRHVARTHPGMKALQEAKI